MLHRITLIGFRASGKSTVGRLLSARLAWPFVDADAVIETQVGVSIPAYFKAHGEAAFRGAEEQALSTILMGELPLVLATGGGAVLRAANREMLRQRGGTIIYLSASMAQIQERLRHNAGGRPSLTGVSVVDEVPGLLAQRDPLYREMAQLTIAVDSSPSDVAERVINELETRGIL